jgi:alpha-N-acetylglucosamine transferase
LDEIQPIEFGALAKMWGYNIGVIVFTVACWYLFSPQYQSTQERRAYVTLMTNGNYVPGVLALKNSLDAVHSKYPLIVMAPISKVEQKVIDLFKYKRITLYDISPLYPKPGVKTNYAFEQFSEIWSKLRTWSVEGFDLMTFLDADILVTRNMDQIFDVMNHDDDFAASFACLCNPRKFEHYPKYWIPENCPYTSCKSNHSLPWCSDHKIENHNDRTMPENEQSRYFNSGMFVFRPSAHGSKAILDAFESKQDLTNYLFGDQDFLNEYFVKWKPLPYVYNGLKTLVHAHPEMWNLSQVYTIHYIIDKPWAMRMEDRPKDDPYYDLHQLWWNALETK